MEFELCEDIKKIPINSIKRNDYNPNEMPEEIFESLKHGIKKEGFITPVLVQKNTNIIIDGEHRWMAAKALGMKEVLAQYIDVDDDMAKQLTVAMNQRKGNFNKEGLALLVGRIKERCKDIGHLDLGFTKGTFKRLQERAKLIQDGRPSDEEDKLLEDEFLLLLDCGDEEKQHELFTEFKERGITCKIMK